jgi:hypothetical protein
MSKVTICILLLLCPCQALAQVQWPQRSIEIRPKPDEAQVVAAFPFTNAGSEPVTITSLRTSCDCTTASLAKHTYAPGEGGSITATFTVGGRCVPVSRPQGNPNGIHCFPPLHLALRPHKRWHMAQAVEWELCRKSTRLTSGCRFSGPSGTSGGMDVIGATGPNPWKTPSWPSYTTFPISGRVESFRRFIC